MPVALNVLEFEPRRRERIAHDVDIGALLRIERASVQVSDACLYVANQATRRRDSRRAEIVQGVLERGAVVLMVADARGCGRRQRQRAEHEVIDQLLERTARGRRPSARSEKHRRHPTAQTRAQELVHDLSSGNSRHFVQPFG